MILVVDLDGTVADNRHRAVHIPKDKSRTEHWHTFNTQCEHDTPIAPVVELIHWYMQNQPECELIFATSRTETARVPTIQFLSKHFGEYTYKLLMRPTDDHRASADVKQSLLELSAVKATRDSVFIEDNYEVHLHFKRHYPEACHLLVPSLDCAYKPTPPIPIGATL